MNGLVTFDQQFNEEFLNGKSNVICLNDLLKFCMYKGYMSQEDVADLVEEYQNTMKGIILTEYVYDENDDVSETLKSEIKKLSKIIDDLLYSTNSPIEAMKLIKNMKPYDLIQMARKEYDRLKEIAALKYKVLVQKAYYIIEQNSEFKSLIKYISKKIKNLESPAELSYFLISSSIKDFPKSMNELIEFIDDAKTEVSILNHFDKKEILKLIDSLDDTDVWRNITETAIYNYMFNYLETQKCSIHLSAKTQGFAIKCIDENRISEVDFDYMLDNLELNLSEQEKKYLTDYLKPKYFSEVVKNKWHNNTKIVRARKNKTTIYKK